MKQLLLICAVVALVGCGESRKEKLAKASAKTKALPEAKATAKTKALASAKAAANWKVIEEAIRGLYSLNKPTGELTKADLEKVTRLYFQGNKLTVVPKGLEKLTQLKTLGLRNNQLTDVKGLEKLTKLKHLTLASNQLTSVKGLEKLTQLRILHLHANQLTDLTGLEKLKKLENLDLRNNSRITYAQIAELQKALRTCEIVHINQ